MKMKILSLQMIPHCFPLKLGNNNRSLRQQHPEPADGKRIIKLINYDGTVKIYSRPIHVSDVLNEYPKYMVCPSDSFYIGQKIPSLSLHDKLQYGKSYLLLPQQFLHSVFSFTFFLQCQSGCASLAKKAQPFDIQKTPSGSLRITLSENFITQLIEQGRVKDPMILGGQNIRVCNTPQLQKDYQQLVGQRQYWKPKLDTISERHAHKKKKISVKRNKKQLHTYNNNNNNNSQPPAIVKQAGQGGGRSKHPIHVKTSLASLA